MGKKTYNGRENIHTGLSGLKDDNKWSDMLNFRSVNRRTTAINRKLEMFQRDCGLHSLFRGYDNRIYAIGSKSSFGFIAGEDTEKSNFKLWRVTQRYNSPRNERSPSTQTLTIRGNYTGSQAKRIRVVFVKTKLDGIGMDNLTNL
tara:strand:- start:22963 stop:23397 length:435 start_codon:yes stop_codon:yes gene_type:complete